MIHSQPPRALSKQVSTAYDHVLSVEQQHVRWQQQHEQESLGRMALQALRRLSETNRQIVTLHYLSGQSLQAIGTLLGLSEAAVKMRLHRARKHLQQEASTMVAEALAQQRLGAEFAHKIQLTDLTIFVSDISGFAELSVHLQPEALMDLLYEYMSEMTQIIVDASGTPDKYMGDAILAFWGAPAPLQDHAVKACLVALEMQTRLAELGGAWEQQGKPRLRIKCGLHSGKVLVGDMGSRQLQTYTVIGQAVHIASHLEKINTRLGTTILVTQETFRHVQAAIEGRCVGTLKVRPYPEPVTIYEVLSRKGELPSHRAVAISRYSEGLQHFQTRHWEQALPCFTAALQLDPHDGPAAFYKGRCETLLATPPEWIPM